MTFNKADRTMKGFALPLNESDPNNWRTSTFLRDLSPVEKLLCGDGAGSEWNLIHAGGQFPIKFKCDGYNHFNCDDYPAHAHWTLDGDTIRIDWGQYGK